jgi:predicted nucleic acid-binding protein
VAQPPTAFVVDTDILIDYLNGVKRMREVLDAPGPRIYYSAVTKKELLAKTGLSATERRRIRMLLQYHRQIPIDERIAERFSSLLAKYANHGLRKVDALVAATAWSRRLPLLTRNTRHYRFISEISLLNLTEL